MPRVDLQKYNKKVENPFAILWRLVCYFKHCRLLLTAAMLSILAYVAATIGAAYCMKRLTNLLVFIVSATNEIYSKYISLILGLAGLYLLSALTNYLLNRLMLECSAIIMKQLRTELFDTMQRQPVRFFDENKTGALMSYYTSDIEATNELLQHSITQLATDQDINRTTNIVVQLETVQAVEHIDEIVQSDFIDMFFIGPGDLSMDMGIFAQFSNPRLTDTIMLLREKTARAGKRLGIFAGNFDAARNWYAKGFDMCIINSELALLSSAVAGEVGKLRSELEAGK